MSGAHYDEIVNGIRVIMTQLGHQTCNQFKCPQADFSGCVLRMAGHDFMDFKGGSGGSDGCTNMADPDNKGLMDCLKHGDENGHSLQALYTQLCGQVSLADYLVIAAEAVMVVTRELAVADRLHLHSTQISFKEQFNFGRTTAHGNQCIFEEGRLPNPENGCADVQRVFVTNMGLTRKLATALMGVHTLGRAHPANSGYNGWWSDVQASRHFTNDYYVSMLAKGWRPERISASKNQWDRVDWGKDIKEMMLNTDMCLAFSADKAGTVPVNARDHQCCAWEEPHQTDGRGINPIVVNPNNHNKHCGLFPGDTATASFAFKARCCGTTEDDAKVMQDCGDPFTIKGWAVGAVKEYAANEASWIADFKVAWKQATENGFRGHLKPLSTSCPTPGAGNGKAR